MSSRANDPVGGKPVRWYRVPFVWFLIAIPATSVVVGFTMLGFAISSFDGLVVDDYYKRGKAINEVLDRERQAAEYGLNAVVELDDRAGLLHVAIGATNALDWPDSLQMRFHHATRAGHDRDLVLRRTPGGGYAAALPDLAPGRWYVDIETPTWRLPGIYFQPGDPTFRMDARSPATGS
jgi:uncharacterized protein